MKLRRATVLSCLICLLALFPAAAGRAALETGPAPARSCVAVEPPPLISLLPAPLHPALPRPLIAIVIDDAGVDQKRTARASAELSSDVTLSFLAYAPHIGAQVAAAKKNGHPIMLHLPWEADNPRENPGPHHLSVTMAKSTLEKNLSANLDAFSGYDGVNNHMGSRFSRHRPGLEVVMGELKKRHFFFLDSKTTPRSIGEKVARETGVPATHRDVFIDDDNAPAAVATQLKEIERIARCHGAAVAIGHPRDATLAALKAWLPTLEAKGFAIATVARVIDYRDSHDTVALTQPRTDTKQE